MTSQASRVLEILAAPVIPVVFGTLLLRGANDGSRGPARLALAFLMGTSVLGLVVMSTELVAGAWLGYPVVVRILAVAAASALVVFRRPGRGEATTLRSEWLRLAIAVTCVGPLLFHAMWVPPRDWDGVMTWLPLAREIAIEETTRPSVLRNGQLVAHNPQYPPLIPLVNATVTRAVGLDLADERNLRPLYPVFLIALLVLASEYASRVSGVTAGWVSLAVGVSVPFPFLARNGGALGAYSDLPLTAFSVALAFLLSGSPGRPLPAALIAAALTLTKLEGLPIAMAIVAVRLLQRTSGRYRLDGAVFGATAGVAAGAALRAVWQADIAIRNSQTYAVSDLLRMGLVARNVSDVAPILTRSLGWTDAWGAFWAIALVIGLIRLGRGACSSSAATVLMASALAPPLVALAAYATHWNPQRLAEATWDRFLLQGFGGSLVLVGVGLAQAFERQRGVKCRERSARCDVRQKQGNTGSGTGPSTRVSQNVLASGTHSSPWRSWYHHRTQP